MAEVSLPKRRLGTTYEVEIYTDQGRSKVYLRTGIYENGALGEIFVDCAKMGSDLRSMIGCWSVGFSIALQNGVALERLLHAFENVSFEPKGKVTCPVEGVTECSSIPDVICRILRIEFASHLENPSQGQLS
jgi:ribonucleoside-diphosphate reductase alpha chain